MAGSIPTVARVPFSTLTPEAFHDKFVAKRTPCVLENGTSSLLGTDCTGPWSPERLLKLCDPETPVEVEVRETGMYGQSDVADRQRVALSHFVETLPSEKMYMTTQKLDESADGAPLHLGGPLAMAIAKNALRPALMGNCVPSQVNVWCGHAKKPSKTPLHHDYHDNLYCLLSGAKTFYIFPPTADIATQGKKRLFSNGLISYEPGIREDGAPKHCVAAWKQGAIEEEVAECEAALEQCSDADRDKWEKKLQVAESVLDGLLDAALDTQRRKPKRRKHCLAPCGPLHFAQKSAEEIGNPCTIELHPGDVLYLPASYFHEVHSESRGAFHLALNLWFHPPRINSPFDQPYEDDFWLCRFRELQERLREKDELSPKRIRNS